MKKRKQKPKPIPPKPAPPRRTWCRGLVLVSPVGIASVGGLLMERFLAPYYDKRVKLTLEVLD